MKLFIIMIQQEYFYEQLIKMILTEWYFYLLILNHSIKGFHFMIIQ